MIRKGLIYFLLLLILSAGSGCAHLFFYPSKELINNPLLENTPHEDIFFKTSDNLTLHGWLVKTQGKPRGTIIFFHGNAGNISTHVNNVLWLVPEGFDVFIFDYRGYGMSEGKPTIKGVHIDGEAALMEALRLTGAGKDRVFVFGQSLGGSVAVYAVANSQHKDRIRGVIIDSAFSGYRRIVRDKFAQFVITWPFQYPFSFLIDDDFSPVRWIKKINPVPVLIIHGTQDGVVPFYHGLKLYDEALQPKEFWMYEGKGHIRALTDDDMKVRFLRYLNNAIPNSSCLFKYPAC